MKIAVVGGGIAGLGAAWALSRCHAVTLFERETRLGGHANTLHAPLDGRDMADVAVHLRRSAEHG